MKRQICFQGSLKEKNYFEGWYYKHVTEDKKEVLAVIPGISLAEKNPHAFIQINETWHQRSYYFSYPISEFHHSDDPFMIMIGDSIFKEDEIELNIKEGAIEIIGTLTYSDLTPIKQNWYAPTIMGPFSYFKMECNHGIVSMDHYVDGILFINQERFEFEDGYGYIEKDYGTSFPKRYLWFQSNTPKKDTLNHKKMSFLLSIADIPFHGFHFKGVICVLQNDKKQYRFSTYDFAKIKQMESKGNGIYMIKLKKRDYLLKIVIRNGISNSLLAPKSGNMESSVEESLQAEATITLKQQKKTIWKQRFVSGGFEISGYDH